MSAIASLPNTVQVIFTRQLLDALWTGVDLQRLETFNQTLLNCLGKASLSCLSAGGARRIE